ncbi:hypothetical protein [Alkalicoccus chagannorensis]|uniref:hypothetical protein n=1 Tax=Alkalicoccus chagannorensis TaxID=427072 RepID=UPI0004238B11|nr:hypothetical protein [Alkalicoccus chagannorensis]
MTLLRIIMKMFPVILLISLFYHFFIGDLPVPDSVLFLFLSALFIMKGWDMRVHGQGGKEGRFFMLIGGIAAVIILTELVFF